MYPRLTLGGAESEIVSLLRGLGPTSMVVTHIDDGPCGRQARSLAARYTLCRPGHRLLEAIEALEDAQVVHLHTINDHPLPALAALLAGPQLLVQTVHNVFPSKLAAWVDHTIVPSADAASVQDTPASLSVIGSGIEVPQTLTPWRPPLGRAVRIVEIRRPDKDMRFTMADLLATGLLDAWPVEVDVLGVDGPSTDPRIRHRGYVDDVGSWLGRADLLVHGSASESYGRVVWEAMAFGALPAVTPLPVFREQFGEGAGITWLSGTATQAARLLVERIGFLAAAPERHQRIRAQLHQRALAEGSLQATLEAHERVYAEALPRHRSVRPDDVSARDRHAFAARAEALLSRTELPGGLDDVGGAASGLLYWLAARTGRVPASQRLAALVKAHRLLGDRHVLCAELGDALHAVGQLGQADLCWARASALRPDVASIWLKRVSMWRQAGKHDRAQGILASAQAAGTLVA